MPRQRFIHPEFWGDPSVGKLKPIERLFFIGCFSNADDEGRLLGSPAYLRATIFPYDDFSLEQVREMRNNAVRACKNLILYEIDGQEYLAFLKWRQYQNPRYPKPSRFPAPTDEALQLNSCKDNANMQSNGNCGMGWDGMGLGRDGMGDETQPSPSGGDPETKALEQPDKNLPEDATEHEREILHELQSVPLFPGDYRKNLSYIRTLTTQFPHVDLLEEARKWRIYKLDKPLTAKNNPRSQFRNWCEIAEKRQGKNAGSATRASPRHIPRAFASLEEWANSDLEGGPER